MGVVRDRSYLVLLLALQQLWDADTDADLCRPEPTD